MSPSNESGGCIDKLRYYKLRIWTKVIMLAHPFRHLDFVVVGMEMGVHVCVENGWLLKLIGSSAILSVWKVFFSACFGFGKKSQQMRSFFKQYTRRAGNELMSVKANKRLIR